MFLTGREYFWFALIGTFLCFLPALISSYFIGTFNSDRIMRDKYNDSVTFYMRRHNLTNAFRCSDSSAVYHKKFKKWKNQ